MSGDERIGTGARQQLAADLAVRGGRAALEYFHNQRTPTRPEDLLSGPGTEIRERLAAEIAAAFPDDAVLGGGGASGRDPARHAWIVAPGREIGAFGGGLPGFAVSVGVLYKGLPFVGAVYDPIGRWLFTACAGRGAWLNERPLHARPSALSRTSRIAVGNPHEPGVPPSVEDWLRRYRLRAFGSTALHLCYVAMGALDLVHDHRALLVDIAGAAAVVLEAGGVLTRADGAPVFPATEPQLAGAPLAVVAGNRTSHGEALGELLCAARA
ncbi:MAG TPA: inositol monophosphatase family protein [Methylomirabilota bacterium]|nr:inositol monophosphatase family protein [Methylomirabilota bacterium]